MLYEAELNARDHPAITAWCKTNNIALVVIGPENLLAEGLSDSLNDAGKYLKCLIGLIPGFIQILESNGKSWKCE